MKTEILEFFSKVIEKKSGIIYSETNYFQLENRLEEVSQQQKFKSVEALYEYSKNGIPAELEHIIVDHATNNETSFFRDSKVFDAFSSIIEYEIKKGRKDFHIWSAASSSGQEPISIAIMLTELAKKYENQINFKITATDISETILKKASQGIYSSFEVKRGLSDTILLNYFDRTSNGNYQIKSIIKEVINYKKLNLLSPFFFDQKLDIVFCRNVLIYQNIEMKKVILSKIYDILLPQGSVLLGSGESLIGITDKFEQEVLNGAVTYKRRA